MGQNHLAHRLYTVALKEHMFCAAEADARSAKPASHLAIPRGICIGVYLQLSVLIGQLHEVGEIGIHLRIARGNLPLVDLTRATV